MGSALNELSDFGNIGLAEEFTKCGEIVSSTKQKYFFSCSRCSGIFSQMAIFVRHQQWEHQDDVLAFAQQRAHDISIYTVEELLNNEDESTVDNEDLLTEEGISKSVSDEDDTGIDSDVELEKEIQELLTSMATSDSLSDHETEYSEYDSGVETKNYTNQTQNILGREDNMLPKQNQKNHFEMELQSALINLGNNTLKSRIGEKSIESENESGFESGNASNEKYDCLNLEEQRALKESKMNDCGSTEDKIHKNYVKQVFNQTTKSTSNSKQQVNFQSNMEKELIPENIENQFVNESVKSNDSWTSTDVELHDFTNEEYHNELDSVLSTDEMQCVRGHSDVSPLTSWQLAGKDDTENIGPTDADYLPTQISIALEDCDTPHVIAEMEDDLAEIEFSKEEIDQMKARIPNMSQHNVKEKMQATQHLSAGFNESNIAIAASLATAITQTVTGEVALDLSFDKSTELTDTPTTKTSEAIHSINATGYCKAATMLNAEQADKLLDHQATSADNQILSNESNILHSSESTEGLRLPPFSNFFKNSANTLRTINRFLAQSTPKEKHAIRGSPLRPSAKVNIKANGASESEQKNSEDIEKVISSTENNFKSYMQYKCNIMKRVADSNEKENNTKRIKTEPENTKENIKAKFHGNTKEIEILSVDIIVQGGRTWKEKSTVNNSNATTVKDNLTIEETDHSKLLVGKQEVSESGSCETNNYESKCHVAADSTSENNKSCTELNYTPEDTLNQLKFEAIADNSITNSFNITAPLNYDVKQSLVNETSLLDDSIPSGASEEDKENYVLLRSLGLKIITDANAEDGLKLEHLEAMQKKASLFASIYADFKYLWRVGKGVKSYEQLELDFSKLMHRLNEHFKFELTITQTKRIVNLVSLWFMQSYHKWLIEKIPGSSVDWYYLNLFRYLPKTSRRIFYCEDCPRYFLGQTKYSSHRKSHMATAPYCSYCQTIFTSRSAQIQHAKVCTLFKCIECGLEFENAASLEHHLRQNHVLQCEQCGLLCANAEDLEWHKHQYPIICGLCNKFFYSAEELQKHRQDSFHWDYTCRTCEVFLPTATQMKQHLSLCSSN